MSAGWPMRPSGVCASKLFWKSVPMIASGVCAFGFDHAGVDGVDADLLRAKFLGEDGGDGVELLPW